MINYDSKKFILKRKFCHFNFIFINFRLNKKINIYIFLIDCIKLKKFSFSLVFLLDITIYIFNIYLINFRRCYYES